MREKIRKKELTKINNNKITKKTIAYWQIYLMISASFAMAFVLRESSLVSGQETKPPPGTMFTPTGTDAAANTWAYNIKGGKVTIGENLRGKVGGVLPGDEITRIVYAADGGATVTKQDGKTVTLNSDQLEALHKAWPVGAKLEKDTGYKGPLGITDPALGHLVEGATWALGMAAAIQTVGRLGGFDDKLVNTLTISLGAGVIVGKGVYGLLAKQSAKTRAVASLAAGVVVAALIFALLYKKENKKIIKFECFPYEPPIGGSSCEECNKDKFRPCSEYRCKALGQACQLLNKGTKDENCAWVNPRDTTSPTIEPWKDALKPSDLKYAPDKTIRPPALGVKIVRGTGCLEAFTPLEFGATTNEPAQCKIDIKHTNKLDEMEFFFGETNLFVYNHTQKMRLPGPERNESGSPVLKNDGSFSLYVRCKDANGNENVDEFSFNYCVAKGPDTTPPVIEKTSLISGSPVQFNITAFPIEAYVNEPAECKWSRQNKAYDDMENQMTCATQTYDINADALYTCSANLTGIKNREDNKFFFRCRDQPNEQESVRNTNAQSFELVLKGTQPLNILNAAPNGTIKGATDTIPVDLEVETDDGAEEGKASCYYSPTGSQESFLEMFESNNFKHKQTVDLTTGNYKFYFRCVDAGGNIANRSTSFRVEVDKAAPSVTRVYREGVDALKVVTNEEAECVYSISNCNYNFADGLKLIYSNPNIKTSHFVEWKPGINYYVKCRDIYDNQPSPNACSVIASASQLEAK